MIGVCLVLSAIVGLPVAEVVTVVDKAASRHPARVVAVEDVQVRPQVSGEIVEVAFANGAHVSRGDVLYRIDPVQYAAAEKSARAKLAEISRRLDYDKMLVERYEELVKTRAVSRDDLDQAKMTYAARQAALEAAEAALAAAEDDLRHCTVRSPIDGRAGTTAMTAGNYVTKGGAPLVRIVRTDPIRIRLPLSNIAYAETFGADSRRICCEGSVSVRLVSDGGTVATGRVEYVENAADGNTDTVAVYASVANPDGRLLDAQSVIATLETTKGRTCCAVPPNAVAQDTLGTYVWVLDDAGRAAQRRVTRGPVCQGLQMIRTGLRVGERVVADGVHRVRTGDVLTGEGRSE